MTMINFTNAIKSFLSKTDNAKIFEELKGTIMKIILGSGIAGLIWGYYHPDYYIMGNNIGGQMSSNFDLGPRYLHNSGKFVVDFLSELKVPFEHKTIKVGYLDDSGFVDNPSQEFREKYFMKSRNQTSLEQFDSSVMNSAKSEFEVLVVDFKKLISILYEKVCYRFLNGMVSSIDLNEKKFYANNVCFKYSKLVSTIPLNIFSKISNLGLNLQSYDMSYFLVKNKFFDFDGFDYIYDCRTNTAFHRITKTKLGSVLDFFGDMSNCLLPSENLVFLKYAQIIPLKEKIEINNVKFVGRYGKWDRKVKIENIIEEANLQKQ